MTVEIREWCVGDVIIRFRIGSSAYAIQVMDSSGRVLGHSGKGARLQWGPSLRDALSRAVYKSDPKECDAAMNYLFRRIDGEASPLWLDNWTSATLIERISA